MYGRSAVALGALLHPSARLLYRTAARRTPDVDAEPEAHDRPGSEFAQSPATHPVHPVLQALPAGDALAPEHYRQLYTALRLPAEGRTAIIGISSALHGEGRTTVALGLAQTLAADLDVPVMLVETDPERPALASYFGFAPTPGLCEVLRKEYAIEEVLRAVNENLSVVTAGATFAEAAHPLLQLAQRDPFHHLVSPNTLVVVDLPPIINHGYSAHAASVADVLVLVVRAGVTPVATVREAIARLQDHPPQGVVLNGARSVLPRWMHSSRYDPGTAAFSTSRRLPR